jgi:hypothetical protein
MQTNPAPLPSFVLQGATRGRTDLEAHGRHKSARKQPLRLRWQNEGQAVTSRVMTKTCPRKLSTRGLYVRTLAALARGAPYALQC